MAIPEGTCVGFIGLGLMGRPMARNLAAAGAEVVICNRSRAVVDELAVQGMTPAETPADVAARTDTVILMLTDSPAVEAVVSGPDGLLSALRPGALVVDMGTTRVGLTRSLSSQVAERGAEWVDAPVSGGELGAVEGRLTIMAGGSESALSRLAPLFAVLGQRVTHVGEVGTGQVAKAANQVIVGLTIGAVAEGLALARAAGADPARVREAMGGGFADSRILQVHGQRMVEEKFPAGGRCTTQHKDLTQALELAASVGLEMPITDLTRTLYERLIRQGDGDLDHSALYRLYKM